jgi:hypothetical protein
MTYDGEPDTDLDAHLRRMTVIVLTRLAQEEADERTAAA